jgi:hypothetical protein
MGMWPVRSPVGQLTRGELVTQEEEAQENDRIIISLRPTPWSMACINLSYFERAFRNFVKESLSSHHSLKKH